MLPDTRADASLRWLYFEQYGAEVLCLEDDPRPLVFGTVYRAIDTARRLGGCALARCLHAPMRWVLLRPVDETGD